MTDSSTTTVLTTGAAEQPKLFARSRKRTPAPEYVCDAIFRPLAHLVVVALLPLRVPPVAVLLAGTATGLAAAFAIGGGHLVLAAVLLQVKTVLDNADGQLARASGRVSVPRSLPRLGVGPARERRALRGPRLPHRPLRAGRQSPSSS